MAKTRAIFSCQNCGAQRPKWEGRCSDCGSWNSFVEEVESKPDPRRGWDISSNESKIINLSTSENFSESNIKRVRTNNSELDRVLGDGLVPGSFILLGGDPGVGKSTLLLQMAQGLGESGLKTLYISGEESVQQTALRAHRLKVKSPKIDVGSESNLDVILNLAQKNKPDVLIVDSIQTIYLPELQSGPGTVSQVRECSARLMTLAKKQNMTVFLIGHVTKDGNIAGPKVLEHMVDTVLSFEGDLNYQFRLLRVLKNRFGTTNELGVFQMSGLGLDVVLNPSELFLEERGENLMGSSVFASIEGSRPILCELQALTNSTNMAMPRRTSIGFDTQRVHLLVAVLDKHLDLDFGYRDIYVNVVGGLKIVEPAADLAVCSSLLSSESFQEMNPKLCVFGEVGLTGEVRAVSQVESRLKEAIKLGFTKFIVPLSNKKHLKDFPSEQLKTIQWIKHIKELPQILFNSEQIKRPSKHSEKTIDL